MFETLPQPPADALHAVMGRYTADPRPDKIDLGVGVYRNATGESPIMRAVQAAQQRLLATQSSKSYLALAGDERFLEQIRGLVFPAAAPAGLATLATVGGTGGVRLGLELAATANPDLQVHVGTPTWPNHLGICRGLGVHCHTWPYFDAQTQRINVAATFAALAKARAGDVVILHGPCHNPSGADLDDAGLAELFDELAARALIPLLDVAYYGLGNPLEVDLQRLRHLLERVPSALLVLSCSKAFGLYRERTGALFVTCTDDATARRVQGTLELLARGSYSMPPAHGAEVVGLILEDVELAAAWRAELAEMRERVLQIRRALAEHAARLDMLAPLERQRGIFSLLPLTPQTVEELAQRHGIYLPESGRINLAGFKTGDIPRFVVALENVLEHG